MYIVAIAWMYVALMMAVAEATNTNGTVLGAIVTFILYGLLPVVLVVYLIRSPARSRANKAKRAEFVAREAASSVSIEPNAASHAPTTTQPDSVAAVREVP
jgi:uncharacterized membrane protein